MTALAIRALTYRVIIGAMLVLMSAYGMPAFAQSSPLSPRIEIAGLSIAEEAELRERVVSLSSSLRISQAALTAIANRLGARLSGNGRVDVDVLLQLIDDSAQRVRELEGRIAALELSAGSAMAEVLARARAAIMAGDIDGARVELARAREAAQAQSDAAARDLAEVLGLNGLASEAEGEFRVASEYYAQAASRAPAQDRELRWRMKFAQANALFREGERFTGVYGVREALAIFQTEVLEFVTARGNPNEWAQTQNAIGLAAMRLAEAGENVAANRDLAATSFDNVLSIVRMPADSEAWYAATSNLALIRLQAYFDGDAAGLSDARRNWRNILQRVTVQSHPGLWASTKLQLGRAELAAATRAESREDIAAALRIMAEAFEVYRPDTRPRDYGLTQLYLGAGYKQLAYLGDARAIEVGIAALEEAERYLSGNAVDLAYVYRNLGDCYALLADYRAYNRQSAADAYNFAMRHYRRAEGMSSAIPALNADVREAMRRLEARAGELARQ